MTRSRTRSTGLRRPVDPQTLLARFLAPGLSVRSVCAFFIREVALPEGNTLAKYLLREPQIALGHRPAQSITQVEIDAYVTKRGAGELVPRGKHPAGLRWTAAQEAAELRAVLEWGKQQRVAAETPALKEGPIVSSYEAANRLATYGARRAPDQIDLYITPLRPLWRRISGETLQRRPDLRSLVWINRKGATVPISQRDGLFLVAHQRGLVLFTDLDAAEAFAAGFLLEREGAS